MNNDKCILIYIMMSCIAFLDKQVIGVIGVYEIVQTNLIYK